MLQQKLLFSLFFCTSFTSGKLLRGLESEKRTNTSLSEDSERKLVQNESELNDVFDVIIIGAGWSGLGAAMELRKEGLDNLMVLEGRDYVGGRCHTVPISGGSSSAELGCQWIQGAGPENPAYNIVKSTGAATVPSNWNKGGVWSNAYGMKSPHRVQDSEVGDFISKHFKNGFRPFQRGLQYSTDHDMSLREVADKYIKKNHLKEDARLAFEFVLDSVIVQEYAASLKDLSLWWWDTDYSIESGNAVVQQGPKKGFSGVLSKYASPIQSKIKLQSTVTSVDWTNDIVVVQYLKGGVFKTAKAKNVIVTVPLGVLKKGSITFTPQLPAKKREAIEMLGNGLLNKCILSWNDNQQLPWPEDIEWVEKIAPLGEQGKWTLFYNEKPTSGKNVLVAFSAGLEAARVEGLSNSEIKKEVMASLQTMFGNKVPEPKEVIITRWQDDTFSSGSYSYYQVGSKPAHRKNLKETVGGRLFFAGEATHSSYPSTVHGAFLSGESAGQLVAEKLGRRHLAGGTGN